MPLAMETKSTSTWFALRNPVFSRLWLASVLSGTFVSAQDMAATWLMHDLGASSLALSLMATAASAPFFLLTLPAGAVADIANRRIVIVSRCAVAGSLLRIARLGAWTRAIDPNPCLFVSSCSGSGLAFTPRFGVPSFRTSSAEMNCPPRSRWEECN